MITIKKEHEFDFGHRVWSQELDGEYSGSIDCKCKHLHGHRGKIVVELASEVGLQKGMVTDFSHLKKFFDWIDNVFDHKFLVDVNDPAIGTHFLPKISHFIEEYKEDFLHPDSDGFIEFIHDLTLTKSEWEIYEGIILVNFVPTAENFASWLSEKIQAYLPERIFCKSLTFYETPKSLAKWKQ